MVLASVSRLAYGLLPTTIGMARALKLAGHEVIVVGGGDRYTQRDRHQWNGIELHVVPQLGPRKLHFAPTLYRWLATAPRFDVVSLHGVWITMNDAAVRYATRRDVPIVLTPHGMLSGYAMDRSKARKLVARRLFVDELLKRTNCFHVISEGEQEDVRALGLLGAVRHIPWGVDVPDVAADRSRTRSTKTILFLGRLHPKKGIYELADAWNEVGRSARDWTLRVVGPDEMKILGELKARMKVPNVEFHPAAYDEAKERHLRESDAFVLPSHSEGLPVAALEAWAYGLPTLLTSAGGIPGAFACGAAIEVRPEPASIAAGLRTMIGMTTEERSEMGAKGKALVLEHYAWPRVGKRIAEMFEEVASQRAKSSARTN